VASTAPYTKLAGYLSMATGAILTAFMISRAVAGTLPGALVVSMLLTGVLQIALGVGLLRASRTAWSFTLSLDGVLAAVGLIALPAIVRTGVNGFLAAIPLAVLVSVIVFLVMAKDEFRDLSN
jgi:hypothetical protein